MTEHQQKIVTYIEAQDQKGKKGTSTCFDVQVTKYLKITKLVFIQYFQMTKSCVKIFRYLEFSFIFILQAVPPYIFNFLYIFFVLEISQNLHICCGCYKKKITRFCSTKHFDHLLSVSHLWSWLGPLFWKKAQLSDAVLRHL